MRIAYIAAGAGGMYCGSCIHDNTLARKLKELGHDVALIPIYTPIKTDEESVSLSRVFYGAINVFLQQKLPLVDKLPPAVLRSLDHPRLLSLVPTSSSTNAQLLGSLTLSMLRGEEGRQHRELEELVQWLRDDFRPDVVHLTNSLLLGFARKLRGALSGAKIVCSVQGEDLFIDSIVEPYRQQVIKTMHERATDVDGFLSNTFFYRETMSKYLGVAAEKIRVVRLGLNLEGHTLRGETKAPPWVLGYLGRFEPAKGFHLVAEAFCSLSDHFGAGNVRLRAAGYLAGKDKRYLNDVVSRLKRRGLWESIDLLGEVDREQKIDFLQSLHVFTMPATYPEPKGLPVLEAMANGVPVVQPAHGAFPELMKDVPGSGLLVEPKDAAALAHSVAELFEDDRRRHVMGERARKGVVEQYSAELMAHDTVEAYRTFFSS